jgi:hypothetical protein
MEFTSACGLSLLDMLAVTETAFLSSLFNKFARDTLLGGYTKAGRHGREETKPGCGQKSGLDLVTCLLNVNQ